MRLTLDRSPEKELREALEELDELRLFESELEPESESDEEPELESESESESESELELLLEESEVGDLFILGRCQTISTTTFNSE